MICFALENRRHQIPMVRSHFPKWTRDSGLTSQVGRVGSQSHIPKKEGTVRGRERSMSLPHQRRWWSNSRDPSRKVQGAMFPSIDPAICIKCQQETSIDMTWISIQSDSHRIRLILISLCFPILLHISQAAAKATPLGFDSNLLSRITKPTENHGFPRRTINTVNGGLSMCVR